MNANQLNFHGIADGHGGVKMVPRENSPVDRALRRIYGVTFHDHPIPLPPMNNLGRNIPAPKLDPDLHQMMGNTPAQDRRRRIYAAQRQRDARRGFDATGCDCTRDQGPSPTRAVQSVTRGINRLSEAGEEFNRDEQLPDPDEHEEPDGDEPGVQVLGTLPPLEPGLVYSLYQERDEVVLVSEPDVGERNDPNLTTADRTYRHRISDGVDPVLSRMSKIHRGFWLRDKKENTLIRHRTLPGEKLELRQTPWGSWDLVLISWAPEDDMMHATSGAEELDESDPGDDGDWLPQPEPHDPIQRQQPNIFRDRRMPEAVTIRSMNQQAKAFWSSKR